MINRNLYLNKLCFYWRIKNSPNEDNGVIPNFLPFTLDINEALSLLIQKKSKRILESIDKAYELGSDIGNIHKKNPWSKQYSEDLLNFINSSIKVHKVKSILEIGCGDGSMLLILKKAGYEVLGIEPSPSGITSGRKNNLTIINDFFPTKKLKGQLFDLIFHSCVLEHVSDPVKFLKYQFNQLNSGGILIVSTPDYSDSIANGDISIILHEHLNYFDKESLQKCIESAGFMNIHIERARFGGLLYCVAEKGKNNFKHQGTNSTRIKLNNFIKKNDKIITSLQEYITKILSSKNETLGLYAPVRALPYIAAMKLGKDYRFFDDNPHWHLKYFGGINIPIENLEDLRRTPVTNIIIMSPTFGEEIQDRIEKTLSSKINIKKLRDFF